jgi:hypothetical protein
MKEVFDLLKNDETTFPLLRRSLSTEQAQVCGSIQACMAIETLMIAYLTGNSGRLKL